MTEGQISKSDIAALRGGEPTKCDWCDQPAPFAQLEPEEAGQWVCHGCLEAENEIRKAGVVFPPRLNKEAQ